MSSTRTSTRPPAGRRWWRRSPRSASTRRSRASSARTRRPCSATGHTSRSMRDEQPDLVLTDAAAWRGWLQEHHADVDGVWLVLAKKGTTAPTSLTYDEALDEALCHGWIDGQVRRRDETTYKQRFTPRRKRSPWSKRNVGIAERLAAEGRMHP